MPKILIADDNTNIQKMVSLAFEEKGIDVVSVGNGETAVRKLPDVNPDLVLADVFMPVRNGYEVCEFVKKDTRYSHVPVILLVGAFDPLDEREARRVGADGVLKKPFVPPDPLIAMVMSALERNPRVAAELAKAKEVIPEPEPIPQALENPAQKAPAPLPDFPEPTAEEAAQIYGFGKGVRTLDEVDEGPASTSPKKPAVEEEEEEEVDNSSTSRDWHRKRGMDLDIPEDIAAKPAFSMEPDFSPMSFPSERDVPPRKVRAHEIEEEPIEIAKPHLELPLEEKAETKSEAPATQPYSAPVPEAKESFDRPEVVKAKPEPVAEGSPVTSFTPAVPVEASAPTTQTSLAVAPPAAEHSVASHAQDSTASTSHWMDLMSPVPASSYGSGSWLDSLSPKKEEAPAPSVMNESASAPAAEIPEEPEITAQVETPVVEEIHYDSSPASSETGHIESFERRKPLDEPRTFARELDRGGFSYHLPNDEPAHEPEKSSYVEESPIEAASLEASASEAPAETAQQVESSFFAPEPSHVAEPEAVSEPIPAAHEFAAETTVAETVSQFFNTASQESSERIPTAPPPNREALAGIPFLQPPKDITEPTNGTSPAADAAPPVDVDSVVQRVVEKLGPQLQEMLAQGLLKPLVENLLQQELSKKDK